MGERKQSKDNRKLKELIAEYGIKTIDNVHDCKNAYCRNDPDGSGYRIRKQTWL